MSAAFATSLELQINFFLANISRYNESFSHIIGKKTIYIVLNCLCWLLHLFTDEDKSMTQFLIYFALKTKLVNCACQ